MRTLCCCSENKHADMAKMKSRLSRSELFDRSSKVEHCKAKDDTKRSDA